MGAVNRFSAACQVTILLAVAVAVCVDFCDAAAVVDVYRMIQYDLAGAAKGSRRAALSNHVSSGADIPGSDLARAVILMRAGNPNEGLLDDVLQNKRLVGGLLFLLPRRFALSGSGSSSESSEEEEEDLRIAQLEARLLPSNTSIPVYFAVEDEQWYAVLAEVAANEEAGIPAAATSGGYRLVVRTSEPRALPPPTLVNIQAWLRGVRPSGSESMGALPTIAVVASYDSFGVAPSLSVGADSKGSGVVALLELARLFARLYSRPTTHGSYNLLFLLTSGGPYNHDGTRQWLSSSDLQVLESVEFALCLDSIGARGRQGLKLHVSRPPKEPAVQQLYEAFEAVAAETGVPFELVQKKVNLGDPRVYWEHEQFSRRRIVAGTLSGKMAPPAEPLLQSGGLTDRRSKVDTASVVNSIKLVAEALAKHIYQLPGQSAEVFASNSSLAVSEAFVAHWLNLLSASPRVLPFLPKTAPIITALHKFLADQTPEVTTQTTTLEGDYTFYSVPSAQLNIHKVASIAFDIVVLLAIAAYLFSLYCVLHISTKGIDDFLGVFRKPPSRNRRKSL